MRSLRIAIIHEWLVTYAGSERVLEQILSIYPDADLFCVVDFLDNQDRGFISEKKNKYYLYSVFAESAIKISFLSSFNATGY